VVGKRQGRKLEVLVLPRYKDAGSPGSITSNTQLHETDYFVAASASGRLGLRKQVDHL